MKDFIKLVILLLAAYGAYCLYQNHIKKEKEPEPAQTEEPFSNKKEKAKSKKGKSRKAANKQRDAQQAPAASTENSTSPKQSLKSDNTTNDEEFEEEVEEAPFIPKTR
jgi:hypothetical protein